MTRTKPLAINPLPWTTAPDFSPLRPDMVREALQDLRGTGFEALHTDIPAAMSVEAYSDLLQEFAFAAAPGYFAADFADQATLPGTIEKAKEHARALAALGVDTTFVAGSVALPRLMYPTAGEGYSAERTKRSAEGLALVAEAALAEGVRFALHPHVSMTIETELETRTILDETAGSALAFGPDTGHLFWAGMTPHHIIRDYADRVAAVHLKDVELGAMKTAARYNDDFVTATVQRHVWTEPGRGAVNFDAVLDALPADFDGWLVVEVDVPNLPDRLESSQVSYDFVSGLLSEREVLA